VKEGNEGKAVLRNSRRASSRPRIKWGDNRGLGSVSRSSLPPPGQAQRPKPIPIAGVWWQQVAEPRQLHAQEKAGEVAEALSEPSVIQSIRVLKRCFG